MNCNQPEINETSECYWIDIIWSITHSYSQWICLILILNAIQMNQYSNKNYNNNYYYYYYCYYYTSEALADNSSVSNNSLPEYSTPLG